MLQKRAIIRIISITGMLLTLFFALNIATSLSAPASETPIWQRDLPARCNSPTDCETSSPVLIDLTGDGILDIVLATSNGHVLAFKNNGQQLWNKDVAAAFGMASNTQQINSSPAIADIDNDGQLEIVVGTGTKSQNTCTQGGVIVLDHNGNVQSGWPFFTADEFIPPSGCTDTVFSTPALGDMDKDGDMEIVVGGFDKRIYVLHHDGSLDSSFPIDSAHIDRFPLWLGLQGHLGDTIWGSASLADMDGDGYLDIILSTDEGNFGASYGGDSDGWICPYTLPINLTPDYCGGALYVIDRFGNHLPGFPKRIHETIQSSPVVYDIDQDGLPEIFVGAGTFYYTQSPDNPTANFRIYGWDNQGNDLPGWEGGKPTGGSTPASPAIGDIAGDGAVEIVALSMDHKVYAWYVNGTSVSGFPMKPKAENGNSNPYDVGFNPILGDYDGDGKMEIFMRTGWSITVVDGNGSQLTTTTNPPNAPHFFAEASMQNNPAVGDIDNDGKLELIAHNSSLYAWDLPNAGSEADWPMFRYDAARTGHPLQPMLHVLPTRLVKLHKISDPSDVSFTVTLKGTGADGETIQWSTSDNITDSALLPSGGVFTNETTFTVTVDRASLTPGLNNVGNITVTGTINGNNIVHSPTSASVTIYLVNEIFNEYLPITIR